MIVLFVGVFSFTSTSIWQADAFEELGCDVVRYDYRQRAIDLGSLVDRDAELKSLCKNTLPDIMIFAKCNKMSIDVVKECNKYTTTVLWYMDNKNNLDNEVVSKMKECDYVFCSRWDGINEALKWNPNVYRLQGGYNPKVHRPFERLKTRDVVFIGEARNERVIYQSQVGFEIINNVYNEEHSKIVSETKINLSFSEGDGISNRIYKLMASKGFVLTQPWYRMEDDFKIGQHLDIFMSPQELKEKIIYYLLHETLRNKIADQGYACVKRYDNLNFAKVILDKIVKGKIKYETIQ